MNEKYYTPTLEEFHIGFEYETYNMSGGGYVIMDFSDGEWTFETVQEPTHHMWFKDIFRLPKMPLDTVSDLKEIDHRIKEDRIRVKYLDEDDLIELGWKRIGGKWHKYKWYELINISEKLGYFNYVIFRNYGERSFIIAYRGDPNKYPKCDEQHLFEGIIKNKSEMKRIMKQTHLL